MNVQQQNHLFQICSMIIDVLQDKVKYFTEQLKYQEGKEDLQEICECEKELTNQFQQELYRLKIQCQSQLPKLLEYDAYHK